MKKLGSIALYTFHEAVRNKILYAILFFAVALILLSLVIGAASFSQDERILKNIGLSAISFFADMIAIFVGVTLMYGEVHRKTIYTILSKPVTRTTYFLGKFIGVAMTLAVLLGLMSLILTVTIAIQGDSLPRAYFYAIWLAYVQCLLVAAVALFFSSFSTPYVSGFLTLGVWLIGRSVQELEIFLPRIEAGPTRVAAELVVTLSPDLSLFTLTTQITHHIAVPAAYVAHATSYGLSYVALFLVTGALIFHRRDFI